MHRLVPLFALLLILAGCGRQSDTHDPSDAEPPPAGETATEAMEEPVTPPPAATETEAPACTPEWFVWVNEQVLAMHNGDLVELYPDGLPEVGTDEWFLAVDNITGGNDGNGADGPEGGSAEWCNMVQQRLSQPLQ